MSGVLATKHCARVAHSVFDKGVAHLSSKRLCAVFDNHLGHRLRANEIVNDGNLSGLPGLAHPQNLSLGNHRGHSAR